MNILAFDIGGTKIAYGLMNEKGCLLSEITKVKTPDSADKITDLLKKAVNEYEFDGLAVCTAGVVNDGKVVSKPLNLPEGYEKIDFKSLKNVPFVIENDANAAAWCEYKIGAAKKNNNAIILAIGTGVGCGIICDNKLLKGKNGAAGEVSFPISGKDFIKIAQKNGVNEQDCFVIKKMAENNNEKAKNVMKEWYDNLVGSLVVLSNLFDTETIVMTGSLAKLIDYQKINEDIKNKCICIPPKVLPAKFENNAGLSGIALLCAEKNNNT